MTKITYFIPPMTFKTGLVSNLRHVQVHLQKKSAVWHHIVEFQLLYLKMQLLLHVLQLAANKKKVDIKFYEVAFIAKKNWNSVTSTR